MYLLVEKGHIKITNIDFPKDKFSRLFFSSFYIQKLSNREQHERKCLIYSQDSDKVFCFCGKLFNLVPSTTKLANEGNKDWRNISHKLKVIGIRIKFFSKKNTRLENVPL